MKIVVDHYFKKIGKNEVRTSILSSTKTSTFIGHDEILDDTDDILDTFHDRERNTYRDDIYDSYISRTESLNLGFTPKESIPNTY
jgi:hypothetical protein